MTSERGSPFNVQRSLHVPNLTTDEVNDLFRQYQAESGQQIDLEVVSRVYEVTRGQPGLVGWFGEMLTEKYNPGPKQSITMKDWAKTYLYASSAEWNNTMLNLIKKARSEYLEPVLKMFTTPDLPFSLAQDWCSYLYMNGILDYEERPEERGEPLLVCRFSSPFVQGQLYSALTGDLLGDKTPIPALDPRDDLHDVLSPSGLDLVALLGRYKDYLGRMKARKQNPWQGQPRRTDLHLTEAVGHFHLYWWLKEAVGRVCVIIPEFPTGNGKVDLMMRWKGHSGVIEVKSFTQRFELPSQKEQAARYARSRDLPASTLAVFVPTDDEDLLRELSTQECIEGVVVTTVAIGAM